MIIRCTNKLLEEMGLTKTGLLDHASGKSLLGDWYANIFCVGRRKCVIFTNARTFFSVVAFYLNRTEIENLGSIFRKELGRTLLDEDLEGPLIQKIVNEYQDVRFGKTQSRSILAVMNEHIFVTRYMVEHHDGPDICDKPEIVRGLNRTPLKPLKYHYAIEELRRFLDDKLVTHDT